MVDKATPVVALSRLFVSPAWPDPSDPPFVNAVARIDTALPPNLLLEYLHGIESAFGRRRTRQNAPRTLDIDLLAYMNLVGQFDGAVLPHPGLTERDFVLAPLLDIAPDWRHPLTGRSAGDLLAALPARTAAPL